MAGGSERVSHCALCAWRADCKIKFRYQNSPALYCREYTPDVSIKIGEKEEPVEKSEGTDGAD